MHDEALQENVPCFMASRFSAYFPGWHQPTEYRTSNRSRPPLGRLHVFKRGYAALHTAVPKTTALIDLQAVFGAAQFDRSSVNQDVAELVILVTKSENSADVFKSNPIFFASSNVRSAVQRCCFALVSDSSNAARVPVAQ